MLLNLIVILALTKVRAQLDLPPIPEERYNNLDPHRDRDLDYRNVLARLEFLGAERCSANVASQWNYETNVNEYTQLQAVSSKRSATFLL